MNRTEDSNNPGLRPGALLKDFRVVRVSNLSHIDAFFYELEHPATGARHIHISNADPENVFSVAFKTVPTDSTGVAHILEHTVLTGSNKFPVRDPFFSMLRRSLSTFMNAFTGTDWTMYPFATQNRKDFYNLMDVYLDAAFFPNLKALNFKQEGVRIELEAEGDAAERLVYKGVVYNEMKGAMSSPDQVMVRSLFNAVYPGSTYRHNSGGDPAVIPTLTHAQLEAFHRRHYHPSNAFFYTYGNLPLEEHLSLIGGKVLNHFSRIDPNTEVPPEVRWEAPRQATAYYPFSESEDPSKKSQVSVAWLTADVKDSFEVLALTLLEQILLGNPSSPLRKRLIDSGLGTALSDGTGFIADHRDTLFSAGLKDVSAESAGEIEKIVFETLEDLVRDGIDPDDIEAAIHQLEFHRKEVTNQPYPYGIKLLLMFAGGWFHGGDPVRILQFDEDIAGMRAEIAAGRPFFEGRIRSWLIENRHRVLFRLLPDRDLPRKEKDRVSAELDRIREKLSEAEIAAIRHDALDLRKLQDSEEDLSLLPTLTLSDIPPDIRRVEATGFPDPHIFHYAQPTAGIFYFAGAAGAGRLDARLIPLVPFFSFAFSRIGSRLRDYADMARRIDLYTGGIGAAAQARTGFGGDDPCLPMVAFSGKCLTRNVGRMFDIVEELFFEPSFSDLARLKSLLLEYRAGLETAVIHNGHRLAISLASRRFSPALYLGEIWSGVHQLQTIKRLTEDLSEKNIETLSIDLSAVAGALFDRENIRIALIGEEEAMKEADSRASGLQEKLKRAGGSGFFAPPTALPDELPREGWSTGTAVSFVARTFQTVRMPHPDAPVLSAIGKLLRSTFLHREIREKGGAYGGFAGYNAEEGLFSFASYRDPRLVSTLKVYAEAEAFLRSGKFTEENIRESVLQVCSEVDKPDPPGQAARKAFFRMLIGLSDEAREKFKTSLLEVTREKILAAAEAYFGEEAAERAVAVISSEEKLLEANRKLEKPLKLFKI